MPVQLELESLSHPLIVRAGRRRFLPGIILVCPGRRPHVLAPLVQVSAAALRHGVGALSLPWLGAPVP